MRRADYAEAIEGARRAALWFHARGYNALPSSMHWRGPSLATYAEFWTQPTPDRLYDPAAWDTTNLQLVLGTQAPGAKLCVLDLDGHEACGVFHRLAEELGHELPATWVANSGGGGQHWYWLIPEHHPSMPRQRRLWGLWDTGLHGNRGGWRRHTAIELLGDRALIVAPPSTHVKTGHPYEWVEGLSPLDLGAYPATLPGWLANLPTQQAPGVEFEPDDRLFESPRPRPRQKAQDGPGATFDRSAVQTALEGQYAPLAASWGLRVCWDTEAANGWMSCHSIGREDRTPSARFSTRTGTYWEIDPDTGRRVFLSIFDLAVHFGLYPNFREAVNGLGLRFGAQPRTVSFPGRER